MAAIGITLLAIFLFGALLYALFALTLSEEQAQEELDDYIMRRLRHPDGE